MLLAWPLKWTQPGLLTVDNFQHWRNYIDQVHHYFLNLQFIYLLGVFLNCFTIFFFFMIFGSVNILTEGGCTLLSLGWMLWIVAPRGWVMVGGLKGSCFAAHTCSVMCSGRPCCHCLFTPHHHQQQQHTQGSPTSSFLKIIFGKTRP